MTMNIMHKKGSISEFVNESWFKDVKNSSVYMRLYTTVSSPNNPPIPIEDFLVGRDMSYGDIPVRILPGNIDNQFQLFTPGSISWLTDKDGKVDLCMEPKIINPKQGRYVIFIAPCDIDGSLSEDERNQLHAKIQAHFNQLEVVFSLIMGRNLLHAFAWEGERALVGDKKITYKSPAIETPHPVCGPFIGDEFLAEFEEIQNEFLKLRQSKLKDRIFRSFEFFRKGRSENNSDVKFSMYWTAVILLAGGSSRDPKNPDSLRIANELVKVYKKYYTQDEVRDKLHWRWCYKTRNKLMHNGELPKFHYGIEQYFHCLFKDLLRHDLGLPCKRALEKYVTANPKFRD